MNPAQKKNSQTRMELRLSSSDKALFERAKELGGYTTLSEFIRRTVREKAQNMVVEHNKILSSQKDQEIFFDALLNPPSPNDNLKRAIEFYDKSLG